MCFLDCFIQVKIQQNMRMTSLWAQVCLEHCTRHDVWDFSREKINPKAYGIRTINTPGNLKSAECSLSLCQL